MKTLQDLFEHEIKDLYSAEKQFKEALPNVIEATTDDRLKGTFERQLSNTEENFERIHAICQELSINPTSTICKAMEGLIEECESMVNADAEPEVKDAGLIARTQRVDHYEISGYGTAVRYAKELGHDSVAKKLQETLDAQYNSDDVLTEMAEYRLNRKAK